MKRFEATNRIGSLNKAMSKIRKTKFVESLRHSKQNKTVQCRFFATFTILVASVKRTTAN